LRARREGRLDFEGLRRIGVVLKRARYFITCSGRMMDGVKMNPDNILHALITPQGVGFLPEQGEQLSLFPDRLPFEEVAKCITGQI
ncbi:MAG: biotin synthase, partial [Oscillospiraceae bacterium]|nr:biotin synthase [Oscillospiraceae bacterium]